MPPGWSTDNTIGADSCYIWQMFSSLFVFLATFSLFFRPSRLAETERRMHLSCSLRVISRRRVVSDNEELEAKQHDIRRYVYILSNVPRPQLRPGVISPLCQRVRRQAKVRRTGCQEKGAWPHLQIVGLFWAQPGCAGERRLGLPSVTMATGASELCWVEKVWRDWYTAAWRRSHGAVLFHSQIPTTRNTRWKKHRPLLVLGRCPACCFSSC